jgi:hypothetical protein
MLNAVLFVEDIIETVEIVTGISRKTNKGEKHG